MAASAAAVALYTEVTNRVAAQTLKELSLQRSPSTTAVDTTWWGYQCQDAIASVETYIGIAWDTDRNWMISAGVQYALFHAYQAIRNHKTATEHLNTAKLILDPIRKKRRMGAVLDSQTAALTSQTIDTGTTQRRDLDPLDSQWDDYVHDRPNTT